MYKILEKIFINKGTDTPKEYKNKDLNCYKEYLSRRKHKSEENEKMQNLEEEVASIKDDLDEIKSLLKEFVNGSRSN